MLDLVGGYPQGFGGRAFGSRFPASKALGAGRASTNASIPNRGLLYQFFFKIFNKQEYLIH
ncbi:hypothetical protein [Psychroflexus lacisalsi]|jgi:hypothetical protein|uniref:hypothetical protein n=1 Tax=Psychroflexus lacisalsi TaxID=503928 RepID=UPI001CCE962D|nr:hypothetical protein [Psychroflexus lacisalsi]MBZ9619214.1 hypothetical protein [Psychroflexus lacisalsi]